jgi:hypothetical protein
MLNEAKASSSQNRAGLQEDPPATPSELNFTSAFIVQNKSNSIQLWIMRTSLVNVKANLRLVRLAKREVTEESNYKGEDEPLSRFDAEIAKHN